MNKTFSIRLISNNEIDKVTDWAKLEGFAPGFDDISIYKNTDKQGIWVACLNNEPIGSIACVKYNEFYGFIGLFIVKKEFRNQGFGLLLWITLILRIISSDNTIFTLSIFSFS